MKSSPFEAIVLGASAGAIDALSHLLPLLPDDFALPIIIVVHMPPDKKSVMAELFQEKCRLSVCEVEDKLPIEPGTIYLAPPNYHVLVEKERVLSLSNEEPVLFSRPSIDVLFESAADSYGEALIGIVLSGGNEDGAAGLKAVIDNGGIGLVQSPESAFAAAMPRAALEANPSAQSMSLEQILYTLQEAAHA